MQATSFIPGDPPTKHQIWKENPLYTTCKEVCQRCLGAKCDNVTCALYGYHIQGNSEYFNPNEAIEKFCREAFCKEVCSKSCFISKAKREDEKLKRARAKNQAKDKCRRCSSTLTVNKNWAASSARVKDKICSNCKTETRVQVT